MVLTSDTSQKSLIVNPALRPEVTTELSENIILTTVDDLYNWARLSSLWPLLYGTACCFIEFAALIGSRFDFDRFGLVPRSSPRQADLLITAGTITMKYAPILVRLYEQMPEPKYVIAMGACTITGGMFSVDSPTAVRGVDKLIPVDVYIPGCPPRPEAIIDAIIKLRKKIANDSMQERGAGLDMVHVPYRGMALGIPDLLEGRIQFVITGLPAVAISMKTGKLRLLATTESRRTAQHPEIPTFAEAGLSGIEMETWLGLVAPTGTPRDAIDQANAAFNRALKLPQVRERLVAQGLELVGGTPEAFGARIRDDIARFGKIVQASGMKPE